MKESLKYLGLINCSNNNGKLSWKETGDANIKEADYEGASLSCWALPDIELTNWVDGNEIYSNDVKMTLIEDTTPGKRNWTEAGVIVMEYEGSGDMEDAMATFKTVYNILNSLNVLR